MDWLWLILLGFGTGAYGVMVGAGGGFILGPSFLIFFDLDLQVVVGTALALVAVNSFSGTLAYSRMGLIDRRSGLLFAAAAVPGSVFAPFVLKSVPGSTFQVLFGLMLIAMAIPLLLRPRGPQIREEDAPSLAGAFVGSRLIKATSGRIFRYEFNEAFATSVNFALGFISSFFGTGGGFLRMPILVYAFGFPVRVAIATSLFALSIYTAAGAVTHASLGHVDWYPTFVWAGLGLAVGGQVGARLSGFIRGVWILRLLLGLVLAMGIRLIMQGIQG